MRIMYLLKQVSAGGLPGPQFQALPEPAPLPPLPRPAPLLQMEQPAEAFAAMAPMAAPGSEAQPGSALQVQLHSSKRCQAFPSWSSLSYSSCIKCQQPLFAPSCFENLLLARPGMVLCVRCCACCPSHASSVHM